MHTCNVSFVSRFAVSFAASALFALGLQAQTFASASTTDIPSWHETSAPEKLITADVRNGVLSLDGQVLKVQLNYNIHKAGYMYFYLPKTGTVVLSLVPMTNATLVKGAFHGATLKFPVGNHTLELSSSGPLMGNGKTDAYVWLDTKTKAIDRYTMVGFGMTTQAPYAWPYSAPTPKTEQTFNTPPPIPARLLPRTGPAAAPNTTTAAIATPATTSSMQR
jgi:hypothetical protein